MTTGSGRNRKEGKLHVRHCQCDRDGDDGAGRRGGTGSSRGMPGTPVYVGVLDEGLKANGATVKLPEPRLRDGQAADVQRAALREVAGSDQKLEELVRNSVTAPYIIKVHDVKAGDATIRVIDLWFVVYADIAEIDPAKEAAKADDKEVEAGNMVMRTRLLKPEDLRAAGIAAPSGTRGVGARDLVCPHPRPAARPDRVRRDEPVDGDPDGGLDRRRRADRPGVRRARADSPTAGSPSRAARRRMRRAGLEALPGRDQLHQDQPTGVPAGGTAGRDARGLRRAARLVPGRADPAVEVQRRRPGPDPPAPPGTRAATEP